MTFYVKIEDGVVTAVTDTAPETGATEWREAVEVNVPNPWRQGKHGHTFDLTKTPVEIVYDIYDVSFEDRLQMMTRNANARIEQMTVGAEINPELVTAEMLAAATARRDVVLSQLSGATNHDNLDAIQMEWNLSPF